MLVHSLIRFVVPLTYHILVQLSSTLHVVDCCLDSPGSLPQNLYPVEYPLFGIPDLLGLLFVRDMAGKMLHISKNSIDGFLLLSWVVVQPNTYIPNFPTQAEDSCYSSSEPVTVLEYRFGIFNLDPRYSLDPGQGNVAVV